MGMAAKFGAPKAPPRLGEIGTVAGVAGEMELIAILESEHEPGPQRLVPVEW